MYSRSRLDKPSLRSAIALSKKREIKYSSDRTFTGSADSEMFGEGYFLRGEGSNYGRAGFAPYDEIYLERNTALANRILTALPHTKSVIILGAARGYLVKAFINEGVKAVGVDLSEWAVENCAKGVEEHMYCGDICDLSLWEDKSFDLAVGLDVFEHIRVPDLYTAMDEGVRVATSLIIDVPILPHDNEPDQSHGTDATHVSCYSKTWWIQQFMARGLEPFGQVSEYLYPEKSEHSPWPDGHDHGATIWFRTPRPIPTEETIPIPVIAPNGKDFKILWWANAHFVGTGYGIGTAGVIFDLLKHYHVRNLAFFGLEGKALSFNQLITYPKRFCPFGSDAAKLIVNRWNPDILITLFDIWVDESASRIGGAGWLSGMHPRWVPIIPIDHDPIPPPTLAPASKAYRPVAMSRFGLKQLEHNGISATYIPHGVDTNIFKPTEDKNASVRYLHDVSVPIVPGKELPWDDDCFVIGKVAANKDTKRKGYDIDAQALRIFFDNNPDAMKDTRVFLHTLPRFPGGFNIDHWYELCGVSQYTRVIDEFFWYQGITYEDMAKLYAGFDILLNASRAEGFGIPIIEAASSGVPAIGTNFTSMPELIKGHGWLINKYVRELTPALSFIASPDVHELADHIEEAYNSPDKTKAYGEASRKFALNYDWKKVVVPLWKNLIEDIREELRPKTLRERRTSL